jgi:ribosomal protein S18 acetylase RimI-like enzyme
MSKETPKRREDVVGFDASRGGLLGGGVQGEEKRNAKRWKLAEFICLHAKDEVEAFARGNPLLHAYSIGDLDDFFWPHTIWYALREGGRVSQLVLLYTEQALPTVLAYAEKPVGPMRDLLRLLLPLLPKRFYAHLSNGVADVLADDYSIHAHGAYYKMGLTDRSRLAGIEGREAVALTTSDTADLLELYATSYPGNFFVPRMLETGFYFGVRRGSALVSVAGVHVYSKQYGVAALGNITTRPDHRGRGLATAVTAKLCEELLRAGIKHIGLNVKADNRSAVACYEKIGFEWVANYGEYTLELK